MRHHKYDIDDIVFSALLETIVSERYRKSKSGGRERKLNNPIVTKNNSSRKSRPLALIDAWIRVSNNRRQFIIYNLNSSRHKTALFISFHPSFFPFFLRFAHLHVMNDYPMPTMRSNLFNIG